VRLLRPATLELFFIDGKPDGMLTAEVFGWTGHLLMAPRLRLADALKREKANFTGVYVLLGEVDGEPTAYVGEGENVANRIKSHDAHKDWWSQFVLITSAANNLNKAHVQYLESRLIQIGLSAANTKLENSTNPALPSLTESARANMESFIAQLLMILPALRVDTFTSKAKSDTAEEKKLVQMVTVAPVFELHLKKVAIQATAVFEDGEFVVQKGSMARAQWVGDLIGKKSSYRKLFDSLIDQGVLMPDGKHNIFVKSYAFSSTSAAGAVCNGRSTNGPASWRVKETGQTYKEWEAKSLE
jgi:hypothetical protein